MIPTDRPARIDLEVQGGAQDGQQMRGLQFTTPPIAVLIVTREGGVMVDSPAGLDTPAALEVLAVALEHATKATR